MIEKLDFVKDNVFDVEHTLEWSKKHGFDVTKAQAKIDKCGTHFKGDRSCDDAYRLNKCLHAQHLT